MGAIGLSRIYRRARDVLESIHFGGLTFRDLTRPEPRRVVYILSAIVNYLHFRHEKLALLNPIAEEFSSVDERLPEGKARIAEVSFPSLLLLRAFRLSLPGEVPLYGFFFSFSPSCSSRR